MFKSVLIKFCALNALRKIITHEWHFVSKKFKGCEEHLTVESRLMFIHDT